MKKIFVTNQPAFYKTNLYNAISKRVSTIVLYLYKVEKTRNQDFYNGERTFDCRFLNRNIFVAIFSTLNLLRQTKEYELILGGWDEWYYWLIIFLSPRTKNSLVMESSYYESKTTGLKRLIKKIFLSRISRVYASGKGQKQIVMNLGYEGDVVITKGVGVFNYLPQPPYIAREKVENFVYVGRLIEVKNLEFLIRYFNNHRDLKLHIVGFGESEESLKRMAEDNTIFYGAIDNNKLPDIYQKMDVFVLPSKSETWGLVVEEALNNGLPLLLSNKVGCIEEVFKPLYGQVFEFNSSESLDEAITKITDLSAYNNMRKEISHINFELIEKYQVQAYI